MVRMRNGRALVCATAVMGLAGCSSLPEMAWPKAPERIAGVYVPRASVPVRKRDEHPAACLVRRLAFEAVDVSSQIAPRAPLRMQMARLDTPPKEDFFGELTGLPTRAEVVKLAHELRAKDGPHLDPKTHIDFVDLDNHCESRAHIMLGALRRRGWIAGKVFANGDLKNPRNGKSWSYHVAPYVLTLDAGQASIWVVDPGMIDEKSEDEAAKAGAWSLRDWVARFATAREDGPVDVAIEFVRGDQFYPTTTEIGAEAAPLVDFETSCELASKGALQGDKPAKPSWCTPPAAGAAPAAAMLPAELAACDGDAHGARAVVELRSDSNKVEEIILKGLVRTDASLAAVPKPSASLGQSVPEGLGAFLIDRANAEASLSFMSKLQEKLCGPGEPARTYFPATCTTLGSMKVTDLPRLGDAWRAAMTEDLSKLPEASFATLDQRLGAQLTEVQRAGLTVARIFFAMSRRVERGENVVEALTAEVEAHVAPDSNNPWLLRVRLIASLLRGLGEGAGEGEAASLMSLDHWRTAADRSEVREMLGALESTFASDAYREGLKPDQVRKVIERLLRAGQAIDAIYRQAEGRVLTARDYAQLLYRATDLLAAIEPLLEQEQAKELARLVTWTERLVEVVESFAGKDYARGLIRSTALAIDITGHSAGPLPEKVAQLGLFAANVASADSPDEVKAALEAAAAPVGSFRAKRDGTTSGYLTINGYVGGSGGGEIVLGGTKSGQLDAVGSVFAPVGLEAGLNVGNGLIGSLGLLFTLVDVGAIVSYRASGDDAVEELPNVGIGQILAPGAYLTVGVTQEYPFTLGFGANISPELRSVDEGQAELVEQSVLRLQAFLALDLVLFAF